MSGGACRNRSIEAIFTTIAFGKLRLTALLHSQGMKFKSLNNFKHKSTKHGCIQRSLAWQNTGKYFDRIGGIFWLGRIGEANQYQMLQQQSKHQIQPHFFTQNRMGKNKSGKPLPVHATQEETGATINILLKVFAIKGWNEWLATKARMARSF